MTAPVQGATEASEAAVAFQLALTKIGVQTIAQALALWRQVPATKVAETQGAWLEAAVRLVMSRRALSRDLAVAYYRLARALRTGKTIPDPQNPIPKTVTLAELRWEFNRMLAMAEHPGEVPPGQSNPHTPSPDTNRTGNGAQQPQGGRDRVVPIERLKGVDSKGDREEAALERAAEVEARVVLVALGPENLKKAVQEIGTSQPAEHVDLLRDDAHKSAGARQAASIERIAMNGGRHAISSLAQRDRRVIGYVRLSRTGTPCGWCAMLISRGLVLYKSAHSATYGADGDRYHDNCHCYAEPVYSETYYNTDPLFELNRQYSELWPVVTKGKSGKAAVSVWRHYFRQQQKQARAQAA